MRHTAALILVTAAVAAGVPLGAQTVGSFTWQLQPFCNSVTVTITQQGGVYTLDGFDDQCGAAQRAPLVGMATINPDGSIGFGLHVVTVPGGRSVSVDARISVQSLSGPWTDSAGNSGTFVFNGAGGGSPRPAPTIPGALIAPGSLTSAQFAPGAIAAVTAGFGTCPAGQYLRGIAAGGTVICEPIGTPPSLVDADSPGIPGADPSIAIGSDGLPIISYWDDNAGDLRVTHCGNLTCSASTSLAVETTNSVGRYSDIAVGSDGLPIIAFHDASNLDLRVMHCGNLGCSAGNTATAVDTAGSVGHFASIAVGSDGLPVISHYEGTLRNVKVTHCSNVACTAATSLTIDAVGDVGAPSSIAIGSDGFPVVAYRDYTALDLKVTHCTSVTCSTRTTLTVASAGDVGAYPSLAIGTDGFPVISHLELSLGDLLVTHCSDVGCVSRITTTLDSVGTVGWLSTIAIGSDGLPVVGHFDYYDQSLKVTHCSNTHCTAGLSTTVDSAGFVGIDPSVAIGADGLPVFAHSHSTSGLRVSKCNSRTCQ